MDISPPKTKVARFGLFEADCEQRVLTKGGLRVRLQDQPFQVLALLLERPGEVVTREEIRQKLWLADTFVEFDDGLNTAIKKLRYCTRRFRGQSPLHRDGSAPGIPVSRSGHLSSFRRSTTSQASRSSSRYCDCGKGTIPRRHRENLSEVEPVAGRHSTGFDSGCGSWWILLPSQARGQLSITGSSSSKRSHQAATLGRGHGIPQPFP